MRESSELVSKTIQSDVEAKLHLNFCNKFGEWRCQIYTVGKGASAAFNVNLRGNSSNSDTM